MKQPKKYTNKQMIEKLSKENGQTFSLLMQLAQEVNKLGGMTQTMLAVMKELPGYEESVEKMKEAQKKSEATQDVSESIQEGPSEKELIL